MFHIDYQGVSDHPGFSITQDILIVTDFHVKHTVLENGDVGGVFEFDSVESAFAYSSNSSIYPT